MDNKMMSVFGVCDGHGQFGHKASEFIRQVLPKNIEYQISLNQNETVKNILIEAFKQTNDELIMSGINVSFSGSKIQ